MQGEICNKFTEAFLEGTVRGHCFCTSSAGYLYLYLDNCWVYI